MSMRLDGRQGKSVVVDGEVIKIVKAGGVFSSPRERALPIRTISSVEVKQPGAFFAGFIQFSIAGGKSRDASITISGGAIDAAQDENSVVFAGDDNYKVALAIKSYFERWSEKTASGSPAQPGSAADEIIKLKKLMDEGVLTTDEFAAKKKQLLGL